MIRVRFAPSPTGALHIGGIRTALYNYLLARKHHGVFILRIEDTDQTRYVEGAEDYILRALDWLGLTPDEGPRQGGDFGPYRQSERTALYQAHARKLVEAGQAYLAFDTPEELEAMRVRLTEEGVPTPKYDASVRMGMKNSLALSAAEVDTLKAANVPYTIRLKVDPTSSIRIEDKIRGEVVFDGAELDDKVLLKADGFPTYHLANVVDDHLMKISNVIRGEEWLSSTAHHVLLYRAFGWEATMPSFAHLPLILKPNGQGKLSKRDGQKFGCPVFPLGWTLPDTKERIDGFDTAGFEPEAVINFLAFLGWNPGTEQELFTMDELVEAFEPERIHKAGARFDYEKALWFNQQYVHRLEYAHEELRFKQLLETRDLNTTDMNLQSIFELIKPRVHRFTEIADQARYFFDDNLAYEAEEIGKKWTPEVNVALASLAQTLSEHSSFAPDGVETVVKESIKASGQKMGVVMPLLRAALTGTTQGPDVAAIISILGKAKTLARINGFIEYTNRTFSH